VTGKKEAVQAVRTYLALLALLTISVGLRLFHLEFLGSVLLLVIAGIEAVVVLLFFMRVQASSKLIWLFAGGGFLWLGVLLVFVITDYISRPWWR
jgi:cytochrome c oxidase subunit IV